MRILTPTKMMVRLDHENKETVIISSPIRLIEGGRAKFVRLARNQNNAIRGNAVWRPRSMIIVRLWIRS